MGNTRVEFVEACGRYPASLFNYPLEELDTELQADLAAVARVCKDGLPGGADPGFWPQDPLGAMPADRLTLRWG